MGVVMAGRAIIHSLAKSRRAAPGRSERGTSHSHAHRINRVTSNATHKAAFPHSSAQGQSQTGRGRLAGRELQLVVLAGRRAGRNRRYKLPTQPCGLLPGAHGPMVLAFCARTQSPRGPCRYRSIHSCSLPVESAVLLSYAVFDNYFSVRCGMTIL